jgi:hypothetical protein
MASAARSREVPRVLLSRREAADALAMSLRDTLRVALRKEEAARALGISDESFDRYVKPTVPVVRMGSMRVYPIDQLRAWLAERAEAPLAG